MDPQKRKGRSVTMYNLIFPVFLIFSPISAVFLPFMEPQFALLWLLLVVGGNLAVDWLVAALALRWQKIPEVRKKSLAALVRVWLAGYAADILSVLLVLAFVILSEITGEAGSWFSDNVVNYLFNSIYRSPYALAFTLLAVCFGGWLIYRFNVNWGLEPAGLTEQQRKRTALVLAVLTAPWLFLLPTDLFY